MIDSATFPVLERVRVESMAGGTLESSGQIGQTVEQMLTNFVRSSGQPPAQAHSFSAWKYARSDFGVHSTGLAYSGCTCHGTGHPDLPGPDREDRRGRRCGGRRRFLSHLVAALAQSTSGSNCRAEPSMLSLVEESGRVGIGRIGRIGRIAAFMMFISNSQRIWSDSMSDIYLEICV